MSRQFEKSIQRHFGPIEKINEDLIAMKSE